MQRIWGLFAFLEFIFAFREIFVNQHVLLQFDLHETTLNSRDLRTFCFEDHIMNHLYGLICLSRDSLSCATRSLDLCILFKFICLYVWYIPPHSGAFHTLFFTPIFLIYFFNSWWCRWSAKTRNFIFIFHFSSQRPHLNYILLSNVYSFEFP